MSLRAWSIVIAAATTLVTPCGQAPNAFATSIAAIRTENEIAIAADSQGTRRRDTPAITTCKLHVVAAEGSQTRTIFAVAGLTVYGPTGLNVETLLTTELRKPGDIVSVAKDLEPLRKALSDALTSMLRGDQTEFARATKQAVVSRVFLARHEAGAKHLGVVRFTHHANPILNRIDTRSEWAMCPGDTGEECRLRRRIATHTGAPPSPWDWWAATPAHTVRKFVQKEIDDSVPGVGGPIDVVRIKSSGEIIWDEPRGSCKG